MLTLFVSFFLRCRYCDCNCNSGNYKKASHNNKRKDHIDLTTFTYQVCREATRNFTRFKMHCKPNKEKKKISGKKNIRFDVKKQENFTTFITRNDIQIDSIRKNKLNALNYIIRNSLNSQYSIGITPTKWLANTPTAVESIKLNQF